MDYKKLSDDLAKLLDARGTIIVAFRMLSLPSSFVGFLCGDFVESITHLLFVYVFIVDSWPSIR